MKKYQGVISNVGIFLLVDINDMHNGISSVSETELMLGNWEKLHLVVTSTKANRQ